MKNIVAECAGTTISQSPFPRDDVFALSNLTFFKPVSQEKGLGAIKPSFSFAGLKADLGGWLSTRALPTAMYRWKCCQVLLLTLILCPQLPQGICGVTRAVSPCHTRTSWCHFPIAQQQPHWRSYSPLETHQVLVATLSSMLQISLFFLKILKSIVLLLLLLLLHSSSNKTWVVPATQLGFLIASFLLFLYYF